MNLARSIHGCFAPHIAFRGEIGEEAEGRESLCVYFMDRIRGISYLDFILANISRAPENSHEFSAWRRTLVTYIAMYVSKQVTSAYNY